MLVGGVCGHTLLHPTKAPPSKVSRDETISTTYYRWIGYDHHGRAAVEDLARHFEYWV